MPDALDAAQVAELNRILDAHIAEDTPADATNKRWGNLLTWGSAYRDLIGNPRLVPYLEETWQSRYGADATSVHLEKFPDVPAEWNDAKLAEKWRKVRIVRGVVTGALEIERAQKRIGSSLEAHPIVHVTNAELYEAVVDVDLAEICITSAATLTNGEAPADAFRLPDVAGVAVVPKLAEGTKCARSWKILTNIGADPEYPDVSPRDAKALREWETLRKAAE